MRVEDGGFDALGILRRRRIVDDHAELGPAVDCEGRIFERDRAKHGVATTVSPKEKGLIEDLDQPSYFET